MGYSPWGRKELDTTEQLFKTTTTNTIKVSITVIFLIVVVLYVEGTI